MSTLIRRIGGILAGLVGVAGIGFAVVAVLQTWKTARQLEKDIPAALDQLQSIVGSIHLQGQATETLLDSTRQHLLAVRTPVEQLAQGNQRLSNAELFARLDEEILRQMESVEHFSLSMQNSMRSMSNALMILDSLPFLTAGVTTTQSTTPHWRDLAASLTQTADLLEQAGSSVARIRSGQDVAPQQLAQLADVLNQIDTHLVDVQQNIRGISETVEQTNQAVTRIQDLVPSWIVRAATVSTVFFVCFGFSQISLVVHAWQLLRRN